MDEIAPDNGRPTPVEALVRKLIALGRILVFDSSAVANRPLVAFGEAMRIANASLESASFDHALDVQGARKLHFRPLPIRVDKEYAAVAVPPPASPSGPVGVPRASALGAIGLAMFTSSRLHAVGVAAPAAGEPMAATVLTPLGN